MGINSKDKRDIYYKLSKKEGYRARSVYKLIQIDEEFRITQNCERIVDLCGAPGSWAQYVSSLPNKIVISVDIQDMEPIEGVTCLKEDITKLSCVSKILEISKKPLNLVLFDGAPDITGIHALDEYLQIQLVLKALSITLKISQLSSTFIGKIFRGKYTKHLVSHFKKYYKKVMVVKPRASRSSSIESFIICMNLYNNKEEKFEFNLDEECEDFEVFSCGSGPDPDLTIKINNEEVLKPMTYPIDPPYGNVRK